MVIKSEIIKRNAKNAEARKEGKEIPPPVSSDHWLL